MAKRPAAGQTKTRLCPPLAPQQAAELYECFLRDTLATLRRVPAVRRVIGYLPEGAEPYFRELAPDFDLSPQRGANLGERLDNLLTAALADGASRAIVLGSDSPTLPFEYVDQAFTLLDAHDVVLGPADDGGYYLIGLREARPRLLREVTMSTPFVLRDTLAVAEELGLRVALLPGWYDVDTVDELHRLRAELAAAPAEIAPHTRAFLCSRLTDLAHAPAAG